MALALLRASPATAQPTPDLSGDAGDWWWIVLIVLLLGTAIWFLRRRGGL
ncbi:MAG: LPXTG cell wall anchor domain-containing protein [Microvirga sp.]